MTPPLADCSPIPTQDVVCRLGSLPKGARGAVVGLDTAGVSTSLSCEEFERRLIEMGLVEGAEVEILHEGFPRRDPIAIRVSNHTVGLRRAEANAVKIRRHGADRAS